MEIAGYLIAVLIGLSLGLVGAGGSILTVPLMIYLFRLPVIAATSYSLFIVGCTSFIGTLNNRDNYSRNKLSTALMFCAISASIVVIIRKFLLPHLPQQLSISGFIIQYSTLTFILFALLMIAASRPLITTKTYYQHERTNNLTLKLIFSAIMIGALTGFLGAGGGFLIVPSLVFILRLEMKEAITISLLIIAINSLIGFAADFGNISINWNMLGFITCAAIVGVFAGRMMAAKFSSEKLKILFGWLILILGSAILIKEILNIK